jgi:hypothetical protein
MKQNNLKRTGFAFDYKELRKDKVRGQRISESPSYSFYSNFPTKHHLLFVVHPFILKK